jgi:AcrR family transcriptional regulator
MKTKDLIIDTALRLFNEKGLSSVTLRDVAKSMNKSYGNITYHFPNKAQLIEAIYQQMHLELSDLQKGLDFANLFHYFLILPYHSFEISVKYLCLTLDHMEMKRNFPEVFNQIKGHNAERQKGWLLGLKKLQKEGFFREDLKTKDFNLLMVISGSVRNAYFQFEEMGAYDKERFTEVANGILIPYLSQKGKRTYEKLALNNWKID